MLMATEGLDLYVKIYEMLNEKPLWHLFEAFF